MTDTSSSPRWWDFDEFSSAIPSEPQTPSLGAQPDPALVASGLITADHPDAPSDDFLASLPDDMAEAELEVAGQATTPPTDAQAVPPPPARDTADNWVLPSMPGFAADLPTPPASPSPAASFADLPDTADWIETADWMGDDTSSEVAVGDTPPAWDIPAAPEPAHAGEALIAEGEDQVTADHEDALTWDSAVAFTEDDPSVGEPQSAPEVAVEEDWDAAAVQVDPSGAQAQPEAAEWAIDEVEYDLGQYTDQYTQPEGEAEAADAAFASEGSAEDDELVEYIPGVWSEDGGSWSQEGREDRWTEADGAGSVVSTERPEWMQAGPSREDPAWDVPTATAEPEQGEADWTFSDTAEPEQGKADWAFSDTAEPEQGEADWTFSDTADATDADQQEYWLGTGETPAISDETQALADDWATPTQDWMSALDHDEESANLAEQLGDWAPGDDTAPASADWQAEAAPSWGEPEEGALEVQSSWADEAPSASLVEDDTAPPADAPAWVPDLAEGLSDLPEPPAGEAAPVVADEHWQVTDTGSVWASSEGDETPAWGAPEEDTTTSWTTGEADLTPSWGAGDTEESDWSVPAPPTADAPLAFVADHEDVLASPLGDTETGDDFPTTSFDAAPPPPPGAGAVPMAPEDLPDWMRPDEPEDAAPIVEVNEDEAMVEELAAPFNPVIAGVEAPAETVPVRDPGLITASTPDDDLPPPPGSVQPPRPTWGQPGPSGIGPAPITSPTLSHPVPEGAEHAFTPMQAGGAKKGSSVKRILIAVLAALLVAGGGYFAWTFVIQPQFFESAGGVSTLAQGNSTVTFPSDAENQVQWTIEVPKQEAFALTLETPPGVQVGFVAQNAEGQRIGAANALDGGRNGYRFVAQNDGDGPITLTAKASDSVTANINLRKVPFAGVTDTMNGVNWPVTVPADQSAIINVLTRGTNPKVEISTKDGTVIGESESFQSVDDEEMYNAQFTLPAQSAAQDIVITLKTEQAYSATSTVIIDLGS